MNVVAHIFLMAAVTYLIRVIPFTVFRKKIRSRFVLSFLHYVPFAVLSAMTIPAIFYATDYRLSAVLGFAVAMILSYFEQSLVKVAAISCGVAFVAELLLRYVI